MVDGASRYATDVDRFNWYQRFSLTPANPSDINERLADGQALVTTDIPSYFSERARTDCETGVALYRLVQLWGTPNVPGRTAGAMAFERDRTTWQYLFDVEYERRDEDGDAVPSSFRLSVYDYKTDVSAGLSAFTESTAGGPVPEPQPDVVSSIALPPDDFLEGVVALAINMVDEAVPATFEELWV